MNAGRLTVLGYALLFLVVPMVGVALLGRPDYSPYHFTPPGWVAVGVILPVVAACFTPIFSSRWTAAPFEAPAWTATAYRLLQRHILAFSLLQCIAFVVLYPPTLANYRYLESGMGGLGLPFLLALALKAMATATLIWILAEYLRNPERNSSYRLSVFFLTGLLIYGASGTGDIFTASFFLLLFLFPRWLVRVATIKAGTSLLAPRNLLKNFAILVIAIQAYVAINIGENIKNGVGTPIQSIEASIGDAQVAVDIAVDKIAEIVGVAKPEPQTAPVDEAVGSIASTIAWFTMRMVEGTATHYYSLTQFFDGHAAARLEGRPYPLLYPLEAVGYRIGVLLGAEPVRPEVQSISRLNYEVLAVEYKPREGTSPGAVASFAYLLPLPLAIVAAIAYLALVGMLINLMFQSTDRRYSIVGGIMLMILLQVFFQSPFDFLIVFDNAFVFVAVFAVLAIVTWAGRATEKIEPVAGAAPATPADASA